MKLTYSISEVCNLLSVGRTTVYLAIKKGDMKATKIGRRTLISASSLQAFLDARPVVINRAEEDGQ